MTNKVYEDNDAQKLCLRMMITSKRGLSVVHNTNLIIINSCITTRCKVYFTFLTTWKIYHVGFLCICV